VKVWDLLKMGTACSYKPTNYKNKQSITSLQFNAKNDLLGTSTNLGYIDVYPAPDLMKGTYPSNVTNYTLFPEMCSFKASDACVNQFRFSTLNDGLMASAQDDGLLTLYDVPS
jgi:hypothetical protein